MLSLLLAAQIAASTPPYMAHLERKPTNDPAVVQTSFIAKQRCTVPEIGARVYAVAASFPELSGSPAAAAVNREVRAEVAKLLAVEVPECPLPARVEKKPKADAEIECDCSVQLHTNRLYSVRCDASAAGEDFGAHPQGHLSNLVFDLTDGRRLGLDEILAEGARPKFRGLVKANLDIAGMVDRSSLKDEEIDGMIDSMLEACTVDAESVTCEAPYWPSTIFTSTVPFEQLSGIARSEIIAAAHAK